MSMVPGIVTVNPTTGVATYTPDDATNYAKRRYLLLITSGSSQTVNRKTAGAPPTIDPTTGHVTPGGMPTTAPVTISITLDPMTKVKIAAQAMMDADAIAFLLAQADVSITIPATSAGDGLQTTTTSSNPTGHPATAKTLSGGLS